jgi:protein gp37
LENTKINWADDTFNPWQGCTKVSNGCDHCYAERQDNRDLQHEKKSHWGKGVPRKTMAASTLKKPFAWDRKAAREARRRRVFCASMADWADTEASKGAREKLWETIRKTPHLDWLLLTKRPGNIRKCLPADWGEGYPNVWLGVTAENRLQGLPRIRILRKIPAAIRFVSFEPLLENLGEVDLAGIDWAIIGGETGPKARSMDVRWARSLIAQCKKQKVAVWVKQLGRRPVDDGVKLRLRKKEDGRKDYKGEKVALWPSNLARLNVRRHPKSAAPPSLQH